MDLHRLRTPFVIVGAVATSLYMPERVTKDIGVLVLASDAGDLHAELADAGWRRVGTLTVGGTRWPTPGELLDVIESNEPWAEEAVGLPVIALPYLVLMKLQASRLQDLADIVRMLGQSDKPLRDQVRGVIGAHKPDALEDVESMIALGELELQKPPERTTGP